ncbi:transposase family protein, partial [Shewanella algae]|uniref:transposase family protein n=1 Tax=Shewanella algae TaxID=38313 RepID=UPI0021B354E5
MTLLKQLEQITDPRKDINLKHNLVDVVFLTLSAILSGATGWKSIQEFGEEQLVPFPFSFEWLVHHKPGEVYSGL